MQQKCGMLINNVNNVKRWFYEKNEKMPCFCPCIQHVSFCLW